MDKHKLPGLKLKPPRTMPQTWYRKNTFPAPKGQLEMSSRQRFPIAPLSLEQQYVSCRAMLAAIDLRTIWCYYVLPALLQKLVGDFFDYWEGNLAGNFAGIFAGFFFWGGGPQNKGSKNSGEISEHFSWENSCLEKIISRQLRAADVPPPNIFMRCRAMVARYVAKRASSRCACVKLSSKVGRYRTILGEVLTSLHDWGIVAIVSQHCALPCRWKLLQGLLGSKTEVPNQRQQIP